MILTEEVKKVLSEKGQRIHGWALCTMDVVDLYTMIPQIEGVIAIKNMLDYLNIKKINGLSTETIIRLSRFVMQNNYFHYDGRYYH